MAEYKSYINALRQCAKEHKNDNIPFANIRTADLCNDTADLLEKLEIGINEATKEIEKRSFDNEPFIIGECLKTYRDEVLDILKRNIGE